MNIINHQYNSSIKSKKRAKSIANKEHDELPRRGVRFSETVIVHTTIPISTNSSHHNNDDTLI